MTTLWFPIWMFLGGLVALVWLLRFVLMGRVLKGRESLSAGSYDAPPDPAPRLSVIVAAKDEEADIETCVTGLLDQDYPDFEVIAVDDRSTDRTPEILQRLAERAGGRLKVITIRALRDGWFGKNNAMREGVAVASGEWMVFTDADCRQTSKRTLSIAMRETLAKECDFLSITPVLETYTAWERIIQPVCAIVLMYWFRPQLVNDPTKKAAYANGAFMLMHRRCYEAIGGHERVRTEVNEDIHMARFTKEQGLKLRVVENEGLYVTRMYATLRQAWRGWSRIFYGSFASLRKLSAVVALLTFFSLQPWLSLIAAAIGWGVSPGGDATQPWVLALAVWGPACLFMQLVMWRVYAVLRLPRPWSLTYFAGCCVTFGMLIRAMLQQRGALATTWRGTTYRGDRVAEPTGKPPPPNASATGSVDCENC